MIDSSSCPPKLPNPFEISLFSFQGNREEGYTLKLFTLTVRRSCMSTTNPVHFLLNNQLVDLPLKNTILAPDQPVSSCNSYNWRKKSLLKKLVKRHHRQRRKIRLWKLLDLAIRPAYGFLVGHYRWSPPFLIQIPISLSFSSFLTFFLLSFSFAFLFFLFFSFSFISFFQIGF